MLQLYCGETLSMLWLYNGKYYNIIVIMISHNKNNNDHNTVSEVRSGLSSSSWNVRQMLDHNNLGPQFPKSLHSIGMISFILEGSDFNIEHILQY